MSQWCGVGWFCLLGAFVVISDRPGSCVSPQAQDRALYEAVLTHVLRSLPAKILIESSTLVPPVPTDGDWQGVFKEAPPALRDKLEKVRGQKEASFYVGVFPPGTLLIPKADIAAIVKAVPGRTREETWVQLRARYGVHGWQAFSKPMLTDDERDALVYYEHTCGSLCGEGTMVWLRRESPGNRWVVMKRRPFWAS